jgi:hypothetical protein
MSTPAGTSNVERRQHPRVPARGRVTAEVADDAQAVTIVDLSQGGFLLESASPFIENSIHQFRIATASGQWLTLLTARSMHTRPTAGDPAKHLTGFSFVEPLGEEARRRVHTLVAHVTSVVAY